MNPTSLRHRQWLAVPLALVAVAAALWYLPRMGNAQSEKQAPAEAGGPAAGAIRVPVVVATLSALPRYYEAVGTVHPQLEALLAARIMGRVEEIGVHEGDRVRKGQALIRLDARDLDAAVIQANTGRRVAQSGLAGAQVAAQMEGSLSDARIAQAKAELAQAGAALNAARARLQLAKAGPRPQERAQAGQAVVAAKADLDLAEVTLHRMTDLYQKEAITRQQRDQTQVQYETAKARYEQAVQAKSMADEGSRAEEIKAAEEAVRQAEAAVVAARASVKTAEAGALQVAVRQQEVEKMKAEIDRADAGLALAQVNRDFAVVNSPFDGVIAGRLVDPGALVNPGVPLLKVQGGALRLEAIVPESLLSTAVRIGATVPVRFDVLHNSEISGRVVEIAPQGDPASHTFIVKVEIPATRGVAAGMFGRAQFTQGSEKRLTVPQTAVWEREGLHYLYMVDDRQVAHLRMVTVGPADAGRVVILSGLNAGEAVVASASEKVSDGSTIARTEQ